MVKDIEKLLVILDKLNEIRGRTRFQKIIFLLKMKDHINFEYKFIPYLYGPYSQGLQLEMDLLETAGIVKVVPKIGNLYVHSLTDEGKKAISKILQKMTKTEKKKLLKDLKKYKRRSTTKLINEAKKIVGASS